MTACKPQRELSPDPDHVGILIWDFQPPELWETDLLALSLPIYGILLWQPGLTDTDTVILLVILICFGRVTYGILVPWPGIEPEPPAIEAQSPNHWITSEVQIL